MAISLTVKYPGQIDTDGAYPYGKPRNRSAPGATDGTPLEEAWMQDLHGFLQAILGADGATPSGTPDSGSSSQYFVALRRLQSGHVFSVLSGAQIIIGSGGEIDVLDGGTITVVGTVDVDSGGTVEVNTGAFINVNTGGELNLKSGSILDAESGSNINLLSGAQLRAYSGSTVQLDGTVTATATAAITIQEGGTLTLEGTSNYPQLSSRSQWFPCDGQVSFANNSNWSDYDGLGWKCGVATAAHAYWRVRVSVHYTITQVRVLWDGPPHGTWPPENRTTFSVHKVNTSGAKVLLAEAADTSDQVEYEAYHEHIIDGFSETFASGEYMVIEMITESGTNAELGSLWVAAGMYATFTELRNC